MRTMHASTKCLTGNDRVSRTSTLTSDFNYPSKDYINYVAAIMAAFMLNMLRTFHIMI